MPTAPRWLLALTLVGALGCKPEQEAAGPASPAPASVEPAATVPATTRAARDNKPRFSPSSVLGGALYASRCQACHGPQGEGGMGPALARVSTRLDDAGLRRVIAAGRPAKGMPALGDRLTSGEIEAVVLYLRTL